MTSSQPCEERLDLCRTFNTYYPSVILLGPRVAMGGKLSEMARFLYPWIRTYPIDDLNKKKNTKNTFFFFFSPPYTTESASVDPVTYNVNRLCETNRGGGFTQNAQTGRMEKRETKKVKPINRKPKTAHYTASLPDAMEPPQKKKKKKKAITYQRSKTPSFAGHHQYYPVGLWDVVVIRWVSGLGVLLPI